MKKNTSCIVRRGRRSRRGLTLIELMVGTVIALFLTAAAVIFASHETKLLGYSTEQVDMQQQARAAIDLLTSDLQMAGAGIGYTAANPPAFLGLQTAAFNVPGGLGFNQTASSTPITLIAGSRATGAERGPAYTVTTHDLGIVLADGAYATLAYTNGTIGEFCDPAPGRFDGNQQMVVFRTEDGLSAQSILFTPGAFPGTCEFGQCAPIAGALGSGCRLFSTAIDPNTTFRTDVGAPAANYEGGEVLSGFKQVVWFVEMNPAPDDNRATLHRAVFDGTFICAPGTRQTCGAEQAYNIENLQYQVYGFNPGTGLWASIPPGPITGTFRLRVDVELVVRNRVSDGKRHVPERLRLADQCIPNNVACGAPPTAPPAASGDNVPRRTHRWSVEIRNTSRMTITSL